MSRLIFTTNQVHQESIYRLTALQSLSLHYIFPCLGLHSTLKTLKNCFSFLQKQRQGHHINFSLEETACKKGTALARFYTEPLKKLSPSIWRSINHTIQQQHCTSRPGLSPRQPDSKTPSLQMALREDVYVGERRVCVILFYS